MTFPSRYGKSKQISGAKDLEIGPLVHDHIPNPVKILSDARKGIHWALPLLEEMLSPEVFARMNECYTDPTHVISDDFLSQPTIYHGATGEILKASSPAKVPRVSRYKMRQWLLRGLPERSIQVFPLGSATSWEMMNG